MLTRTDAKAHGSAPCWVKLFNPLQPSLVPYLECDQSGCERIVEGLCCECAFGIDQKIPVCRFCSYVAIESTNN